MICFYKKIGKIDGKSYYFNIPYCASKKFIEYVSNENDLVGEKLFGIKREKTVETMYAVDFWVAKYDGYDFENSEDRPEYKIHYHMYSREDYHPTYNPCLRKKNEYCEYSTSSEITNEFVFYSVEDACKFLIKFMEDKEITEVCVSELSKDIQETTKEVKRQMGILNRITDAMNYV